MNPFDQTPPPSILIKAVVVMAIVVAGISLLVIIGGSIKKLPSSPWEQMNTEQQSIQQRLDKIEKILNIK